MNTLVSYEKDGIKYAKKELAHNSTLAVLKAENKDLYNAYRIIESCMEDKYECFSLVFDDGILIHSLPDDFIGFVMNISEEDDEIVIATTGDREFRLSKNNQEPEAVTFSRILTAVRLPNGDFTDIFLTNSNSITINGHVISAIEDNNFNEIVVCDKIKRYGFLAGYNSKAYVICNENKSFMFLFDYPECDISTQFRDLGFFWLNGEDILFRTNYGYRHTQDFLVREIKIQNGLAEVICSTKANPDTFFTLEV